MPTLSRNDLTQIDRLRSIGWPRALELIARGLEQDAIVCECEQWPLTAEVMVRYSEELRSLSSDLDKAIVHAESTDVGIE